MRQTAGDGKTATNSFSFILQFAILKSNNYYCNILAMSHRKVCVMPHMSHCLAEDPTKPLVSINLTRPLRLNNLDC